MLNSKQTFPKIFQQQLLIKQGSGVFDFIIHLSGDLRHETHEEVIITGCHAHQYLEDDVDVDEQDGEHADGKEDEHDQAVDEVDATDVVVDEVDHLAHNLKVRQALVELGHRFVTSDHVLEAVVDLLHQGDAVLHHEVVLAHERGDEKGVDNNQPPRLQQRWHEFAPRKVSVSDQDMVEDVRLRHRPRHRGERDDETLREFHYRPHLLARNNDAWRRQGQLVVDLPDPAVVGQHVVDQQSCAD